MIRANNAARAFQKRTIRPLYAWHSAVPYACFLDTSTGVTSGAIEVSASASGAIYPGQVAVKTTGEQMRLHEGSVASIVPFGLFNNFIGGVMDELGGGTEIGVWVGGRDAVFEVLAGPVAATGANLGESPLDSGTSWTSLNATLGGAVILSSARGRLVSPGATGLRVGRLIEAVSNNKIIVQLSLAEA